MAVISQKMRQVDQRSEITATGYMRDAQTLFESEDTNPYYNIMIHLIVRLCLMFYAMDEYWTKKNISKSCDIGDEGTKLECIQRGWHNTSFGNMKIPSKGNLVYRWWYRIICEGVPYFCILEYVIQILMTLGIALHLKEDFLDIYGSHFYKVYKTSILAKIMRYL